jgi:uncharacterized protein YecE (DUF72 family)
VKSYRFGCSGWSYPEWIGKFYPESCTKETMLEEYAKHFRAVELNMSFYRLPSESAVSGWHHRTPSDFIICPKMNRKITHVNRLISIVDPLYAFISRMNILEAKLGPILIQLPPSMRFDAPILESFFRELPREKKFAIEFRNKDWFAPRIRRLVEKYGVATCLVDSPEMVVKDEVTASFSYIRWHGRKTWYNYDYSDDEIDEWAKVVDKLPVNEVYGFWNNDYAANAPKNCLSLVERLNRLPIESRKRRTA